MRWFLPPGLEVARDHRPLFADYILGLCIMAWGLHVLWFPQHDLTELQAYRWVHIPPWSLAGWALMLGLGQVGSAVALTPWLRRTFSFLAAAFFAELSFKVFGSQPSAPGSAIDLALTIGDLSLFLWPRL